MRFLIFGGPGIGDTVIEAALAKGLKQCFPEAEVDLIMSNALSSNGILKELLECQDYIDHCFNYSKKQLFKTSLLLIKLRHRKYNYGFSCTTPFKTSNVASKICTLIGCKSIIKKVGACREMHPSTMQRVFDF